MDHNTVFDNSDSLQGCLCKWTIPRHRVQIHSVELRHILEFFQKDLTLAKRATQNWLAFNIVLSPTHLFFSFHCFDLTGIISESPLSLNVPSILFLVSLSYSQALQEVKMFEYMVN